jgi:hypothetical protein
VPAAPPRYRVKLDRDERSCLEEILAADPRVVLVEDDLHYFEGRSRWKDEVICPTLVVGGADCPRPSSEGDGIRQASDLAALAPCMARGRMEDAMQQIEHLSYACRPTQRDGADIRVPRDIGSEALALSLPEPRPPLWLVPAAMAAVLLTIEWCLYQRRWTD